MKPLRKRILLIVGAITLTGSALAFTHHHSHNPEKHASWIVKKISKKLELDESQTLKLERVKDQIIATGQKVHDSRQQTQNEILALLAQETFDQNKALAMINAKTIAVQTEAPEMIGVIGDFYDNLSTEQRQVLRTHIQAKLEHLNDRHDNQYSENRNDY